MAVSFLVVVLAFQALAGLVHGAAPRFDNTNWDVVQGEPFTLHFILDDGADATITLMDAESTSNLKTVSELTTSASGNQFTVTIDNVPTGSYAFKIEDNDTGDINFSPVFPLEAGSGGSDGSSTSSRAESPTTESSTVESSAAESSASTTSTAAESSTSDTAATDAATTTQSTTTTISTTFETSVTKSGDSTTTGPTTRDDASQTTATESTAADPASASESSSQNSGASSGSGSGGGLSTGAIAGIGAGAGIGGILVLAVLGWFFYKRGKAAGQKQGTEVVVEKKTPEPVGVEMGGNPISELEEKTDEGFRGRREIVELP